MLLVPTALEINQAFEVLQSPFVWAVTDSLFHLCTHWWQSNTDPISANLVGLPCCFYNPMIRVVVQVLKASKHSLKCRITHAIRLENPNKNLIPSIYGFIIS